MSDGEKQPLLRSQPVTQPERPLRELERDLQRAQRAYFRAWARTTSGRWHKRVMVVVTSFLSLFMLFCVFVIVQNRNDPNLRHGHPPLIGSNKVALEAHIMSKCPDAKDCLHDLILPAMQLVSDQVDFRLSYIGSETHHDDGVLCMHGPKECLGNIIELCAAHLYPDPKIYLGFTMCLTRNYEEIPERALVEDCALEHGIAMEKLNECTVDEDGTLGLDMLKHSFHRSTAANVTKSCTVRLNDQVRCIRDGGKWTDCEGGHSVDDLVRDIRALSDRGFSFA